MGERIAREAPNLQSVVKNPERAMDKLMKEIKLKRMAGPFAENPIKGLLFHPLAWFRNQIRENLGSYSTCHIHQGSPLTTILTQSHAR